MTGYRGFCDLDEIQALATSIARSSLRALTVEASSCSHSNGIKFPNKKTKYLTLIQTEFRLSG